MSAADELAYGVVIVHYGDPDLTSRCLDAVGCLERKPEACVVVWNDTNTAPASVSLEQHQAARILTTDRNLGFAGGANLGVRSLLDRAPLEAVWILNNDAEPAPSCAGLLVEALCSRDGVGMVGPCVVRAEDDRVWHDGGRVLWPDGRVESFDFGRSPQQRAPFPVEFISGCAPMIRADAFHAVGGFDERYFLYYEDVAFSLGLAREGFELLQVSAARVRHVGSASVDGLGPAAGRYYRLRNRLLFCAEYSPAPQATQKACARLRARSIARAFRYLLSGRGGEARAIQQALSDAQRRVWGPYVAATK